MDELKPPVVIGGCESCGYTLYDIDPFNSDCEACCARIVNERDALRARVEAAEKELAEMNDLVARLLGEPAMKAFVALCAHADQKGES